MIGQEISEVWKGKGVSVELLYSQAGIATQILIKGMNEDILVDVGDGTLRELRTIRLDFSTLKGIIITHGHYDHMGGLWSLLGFLRMVGRNEELVVVFPNGSKEPDAVISKFLDCYSDSMPFELKLIRLDDGDDVQVGGFKIKPYTMLHRGSTKSGVGDFIPAFGYSIKYQGQIIAISGDTAYCDNLKKLVEGADFALVEATWSDKKPSGHDEVHLSVDEALEVARLSKSYKLIHFTQKSEAYFKQKYK